MRGQAGCGTHERCAVPGAVLHAGAADSPHVREMEAQERIQRSHPPRGIAGVVFQELHQLLAEPLILNDFLLACSTHSWCESAPSRTADVKAEILKI